MSHNGPTSPKPKRALSEQIVAENYQHHPKRAKPTLGDLAKRRKDAHPPRKKKRSEGSKAWRPRAARKGKPGSSISALEGNLGSPASKSVVVTAHSTSYAGAATVRHANLSTPEKGACSSTLTINAENETFTLKHARKVSTHLGDISLYLTEDKIDQTPEIIPQPPENLEAILDELGLPKSNVTSITDEPITLASLAKVRKIKSQRSQDRVPSNASVTQVPAKIVAQILGFTSTDWQWLHEHGHGLVGDIAQVFDNFVLGKTGPNGVMNDIAESVVHDVLAQEDAPKTVYLSVHVKFQEGFERARLARRITWVLKDGPGTDYSKIVKFEFTPLVDGKLCQTEIDTFKDLLPKLFNEGQLGINLETPTKPSLPGDYMSPSPQRTTAGSRVNEGMKPKPLLFSPAKAFENASHPQDESASALFPDLDLPAPKLKPDM